MTPLTNTKRSEENINFWNSVCGINRTAYNSLQEYCMKIDTTWRSLR
ncbi:hypothetical protein AAZX31_13G197100 [Glycine max]